VTAASGPQPSGPGGPTHPTPTRPTTPSPPPPPSAFAVIVRALLVAWAIVAVLNLAACWDDGPTQTCGETNVGTNASPSYEFSCEVNR
jgi:hypothetical protein